MTFTKTYIDFGGKVYFFDEIDKLDKTKENAMLHYIAMTCKSWTFCRMTQEEKERCIKALQFAEKNCGALRGTFRQRWDVLQAVYSAYLSGIGYDGPFWRENGIDCPAIFVEVEGGLVTNIYSDKPVTADVLDHDNLAAGDEYAAEVYRDLHEAKYLHTVW